jgi:hypothetical protein
MIKPNDTIGVILLFITILTSIATILMRLYLRPGPIFRRWSNTAGSLSYYYTDQEEQSTSSPSTDVYQMEEQGADDHQQRHIGQGNADQGGSRSM